MDFNINAFLKKFKKITPPDDFLKKTFILIVKKKAGIHLEKSDIKVEHNIIYLSSVSPAIKSELYIQKPTLLKQLNAELLKGRVTDIR